ncbi:MAG: hypothetical protein JWR52_2159 [Marmoricola sp.]|nr:hypothetical protein [Marmoricola sp.]
MIISGLIRKQLIAFTIASIIGILVLGVVFLRIPEALGIGRYTVSADFTEAAGLYTGAQVNYRGTPVGKVRSLKLTGSGIQVDLSIRNSIEIPRDTRAEIHSTSAVGEQYVELVPSQNPSAADLHGGDVIPVSRTSVPVGIGPVLDNVAKLVASVPQVQLSRLLTQTSTALEGRGSDLQQILDGSRAFLQQADAAYPQTQALLQDTEPLLSTVNAAGSHFEGLTSKLAQVSDQLRAGDKNLQALLATGPTFTSETTSFLQDVGPSIPGFLAPLKTVATVLATYQSYLAQLLSDYPTALSMVQSVTLPERGGLDAVRLTLSQANKPSECTEGFLPVAQWRLPDDNGPAYTPLYYCAAAKSDPRAVRGARNVPCPGDPARREPTAADCQRK